MLKRAMLLVIAAFTVSCLYAQLITLTTTGATFATPTPYPLTLDVTPRQQSCPAGSDVIYQMSAQNGERRHQFGIQGLPAGVTAQEMQPVIYDDERRWLIHVDASVPPGLYTAQVSVNTYAYPWIMTKPLTLEVTACSESAGGRFAQTWVDAQQRLVLKGADGRALYYESSVNPFQVCGSHSPRRLVITLNGFTMADFQPQEELPTFLLLRSLAYPARDDAIVVGVSGFNAQDVALSTRVISTGLQLSADITPGYYWFTFRGNDVGSGRGSRQATVTYNVELIP